MILTFNENLEQDDISDLYITNNGGDKIVICQSGSSDFNLNSRTLTCTVTASLTNAKYSLYYTNKCNDGV